MIWASAKDELREQRFKEVVANAVGGVRVFMKSSECQGAAKCTRGLCDDIAS